MKTGLTIEILDSWSISEKVGIIVELKYRGTELPTGLPEGTKLKSRQSGRKWAVKSRLLFMESMDKQKRFTGEKENLVHTRFATIEDLKKAKAGRLNKEGQTSYQYTLDPIGHRDKPNSGEELDIIEND